MCIGIWDVFHLEEVLADYDLRFWLFSRNSDLAVGWVHSNPVWCVG
ncbi:hypothetical protein V6Z11_D09G127900 [Gossypium hirsutum]